MVHARFVCNALPWFFVTFSHLFGVGVSIILSTCRRDFYLSNSRKMLVGWPTVLHIAKGGDVLETLGVSTFFPFLFPFLVASIGVAMGVSEVMMASVEVMGIIPIEVILEFTDMTGRAKYQTGITRAM